MRALISNISTKLSLVIFGFILLFSETTHAQGYFQDFDIPSNYLNSGDLEMDEGESISIQYTVTVSRANISDGVNFQFRFGRAPYNGGAAVTLTSTQSITTSDFQSGATQATKQFSLVLSQGLSSTQLQNGDKIGVFVYESSTNSWIPVNNSATYLYDVTVNNLPPANPNSFTLVGIGISIATFDYGYSPSSDIDGYRLYDGNMNLLWNKTTQNGGSFQAKKLEPCTSYQFTLKAVDSEGLESSGLTVYGCTTSDKAASIELDDPISANGHKTKIASSYVLMLPGFSYKSMDVDDSFLAGVEDCGCETSPGSRVAFSSENNNEKHESVQINHLSEIEPQLQFEETLIVYPIPTKDQLNIAIPEKISLAESIDVIIYDMSGSLMFNGKIESIKPIETIDVSFLKTGSYILHLDSDGYNTSVRIQKN